MVQAHRNIGMLKAEKQAPVILLRLTNSRDQEMVKDVLEETYKTVTDSSRLPRDRYDLLVTDEHQFRRVADSIGTVHPFGMNKAPVLLLAKQNMYHFEKSNILGLVDDFLSIPTSPRILHTRINLLLKTREYEKKLEREKGFVDAILEMLPNIFFMINSRMEFVRWNRNLVKDLNYTNEEIASMSPLEYLREEDRSEVLGKIEEVFRTGAADVEIDLVTKKGKAVRYKISGKKFTDGEEEYIIGTSVNISRQQRMLEALKASNSEKQVLLQEIHHRVKNNLAVISSMLQLQEMESVYMPLNDKLQDSQMRIKSMAAIHELLYRSENFSRVDMKVYLDQLLQKVQHMHRSEREIHVETDLDSVNLNINQAIPCALIANEIITNAFKHAFTGRDKGQITVRLKLCDGMVYLSFADDGVGIPDTLSLENPSTLGIRLITVLKRQLHGELDIHSEETTRFTLSFPRVDKKGSSSNYTPTE